MGRIETALIRHYLKPTVTSDLPGRLRLSFKGYQMLPKEALPHLHYVQDVMTMLPGVRPMTAFASAPTQRTSSVLVSTATTEGSRMMMPLPFM